MRNTKTIGNKAEAVIISEFCKNDVPVLIPFGDNEKYDVVFEKNKTFFSVQIKHGRIINNCIVADIRHRHGIKRVEYETYFDKVDFIAIYCSENNKSYLINLKKFGNKTMVMLRIERPKNNSSISTVIWAKDYEFETILKQL